MGFTFSCPHCNQELEAEDEWIGQEADCPVCGRRITIMQPARATDSVEETSQPTEAVHRRFTLKNISDNSIPRQDSTTTYEPPTNPSVSYNSTSEESTDNKSQKKKVANTVVGILILVGLFWSYFANGPKVTDSEVISTARKAATELVEEQIPGAKVLSMNIDKATDNRHGNATVTIMFPSGEKIDFPAQVVLVKVNSFRRVLATLGLWDKIPYEIEVSIGQN